MGVYTVDAYFALIVVDDIQHHLDGGGLTGAIGADETKYFAFSQGKTHIAQRADFLTLDPERLTDALELQRRTQG